VIFLQSKSSSTLYDLWDVSGANLRKISRETFHIRGKSQLGCSSKVFTPEEDGSDIILGQSRRGTKSAAALSTPISIHLGQRIMIVGYDRSRTCNRKQSDKGTENVRAEWWMKFFRFCARYTLIYTHVNQNRKILLDVVCHEIILFVMRYDIMRYADVVCTYKNVYICYI